MLLLDGHRCHAVADFQGERYSIVFFTASEYETVTVAATEFLQGLGVVWPSVESMDHFHSIIAHRGAAQRVSAL